MGDGEVKGISKMACLLAFRLERYSVVLSVWDLSRWDNLLPSHMERLMVKKIPLAPWSWKSIEVASSLLLPPVGLILSSAASSLSSSPWFVCSWLPECSLSVSVSESLHAQLYFGFPIFPAVLPHSTTSLTLFRKPPQRKFSPLYFGHVFFFNLEAFWLILRLEEDGYVHILMYLISH